MSTLAAAMPKRTPCTSVAWRVRVGREEAAEKTLAGAIAGSRQHTRGLLTCWTGRLALLLGSDDKYMT